MLAWRGPADEPGVVIADVAVGRTAPTLEPGEGFWLHARGIVPAAAWAYQNAYGRRWYRQHALGRPFERRSLAQLAPPPGAPVAS